jgi:hypothetical protein
MPFSTNMNPPSPIILISNMPSIIASYMHHSPDSIFPGIFRDDCLLLAATVLFRNMWAEDVILWDFFSLTTHTQRKNIEALV